MAISEAHKALLFRALREKKAASQTRVKLARHLINMQLIEREMATYNGARLQKMAASNTDKLTRLKFAALATQYQVEKQAVLGAAAKLLGKGLMGAGRMVGKGVMGVGGATANAARGAITAAPLLSAGAAGAAGLYGGSKLPTADQAGGKLQQMKQNVQQNYLNPMYYGVARRYNNATLPLRKAYAGAGGALQGIGEGASNLASLPGRGLRGVGQGLEYAGQGLQSAGNAIGGGAKAVGRGLVRGPLDAMDWAANQGTQHVSDALHGGVNYIDRQLGTGR